MFPPPTRILIVDDMAAMLQLLRKYLNSLGYLNISEAKNGKAALEILNAQHGMGKPVELILSDWNMDEMTGIELLNSVRSSALFKTVPFLMITTEGERKSILEAIKAQATGYLVKPFTVEHVKKCLEFAWKKRK